MVGRLLGLAVFVCFVTGVLSHYLQEPPGWLSGHLPTRPFWGYRFSQGLHVISGIAAVPLLLVKLWTVYPRLFVWPPVKSPAHTAERLSIAVLVSCALLEVFMGLLNTCSGTYGRSPSARSTGPWRGSSSAPCWSTSR
jgi:hypothetical protein